MAQHVDFTRSVYCVSGSNLAFPSLELVHKYLHKKWGLSPSEVTSFGARVGDFQSGADVITVKLNDQEINIMQRRLATDDNIDAAIQLGW